MDHPSKRLVKCGVCDVKMRRDELKSVHFPKYHPGILYKEKGERNIKSMFGRSMESVTQSFRNKSKTVSVQQSSESMETEEVPDVTLATEDIELDYANIVTLEKTTFDDTKEPEPEKESRKEHEEIMTGIESIMKRKCLNVGTVPPFFSRQYGFSRQFLVPH